MMSSYDLVCKPDVRRGRYVCFGERIFKNRDRIVTPDLLVRVVIYRYSICAAIDLVRLCTIS